MKDEGEERMRMELETQLAQDTEGTLRDELKCANNEQIVDIETKLNAGVEPKLYEKINTIRTGLKAANLILDATWAHYHG